MLPNLPRKGGCFVCNDLNEMLIITMTSPPQESPSMIKHHVMEAGTTNDSVTKGSVMRTFLSVAVLSTMAGCGIATVPEKAEEITASFEAPLQQAVYMYIEQLAPTQNATGNRFVWEAHVPDYNPQDCSYSWHVAQPGVTTILFRQTTWIGDAELLYPGDYGVSVQAKCTGWDGAEATGSASLSVYVAGTGPTYPNYYPAPPSGSNILEATNSAASPTGIGLCTFWTAYDFGQHKFYHYRSTSCSGGGRRKEFYTTTWHSWP